MASIASWPNSSTSSCSPFASRHTLPWTILRPVGSLQLRNEVLDALVTSRRSLRAGAGDDEVNSCRVREEGSTLVRFRTVRGASRPCASR